MLRWLEATARPEGVGIGLPLQGSSGAPAGGCVPPASRVYPQVAQGTEPAGASVRGRSARPRGGW